MRLWLILALQFATAWGEPAKSSVRYQVAITKDCFLYIGEWADKDFGTSSGSKCAEGVEFMVTPSINPSVLVFRRSATLRGSESRYYKLDVYGRYLDKEKVKINLEEEFETVDYEYALRRDGYDCEFASDARGGFPMTADANIMHTLVRCRKELDSAENPSVPQLHNDEELLGFMRSTLHSGLQIVATPPSSLIFFRLPEVHKPVQFYTMRFAMIPVDFDKAKTTVMDSAVILIYKYGNDNATTNKINFRLCNVHEVSQDGLLLSDEYDTTGSYANTYRFVDYYNVMVGTPDGAFTQLLFNDVRALKDTFVGFSIDKQWSSKRLKYAFKVSSNGEANSDKDWAFRTKIDPISQSTGQLLTSCDPAFDEKKKECTERAAGHQKIIMIIAILAVFEVLIIIATLVIFSLCIFKQRKRKRLHHERRKHRKHKKHHNGNETDTTNKDTTQTNNKDTASAPVGAPTSDSKPV